MRDINPDNGHGAADEFRGEDYPSAGTDVIFRDFAGHERITVRREVCERHVYSTAGQCFACGQHRD